MITGILYNNSKINNINCNNNTHIKNNNLNNNSYTIIIMLI